MEMTRVVGAIEWLGITQGYISTFCDGIVGKESNNKNLIK